MPTTATFETYIQEECPKHNRLHRSCPRTSKNTHSRSARSGDQSRNRRSRARSDLAGTHVGKQDPAHALNPSPMYGVRTTRQETAQLKASTRTRRIAKAHEAALQAIGSDFAVIPLFETLLEFLLATAARRSEALALLWTQTFPDAQTAFFFPDTKNGRSPTVPLRPHLVQLLNRLARGNARLCPISVDALKGALMAHLRCSEALLRVPEAGKPMLASGSDKLPTPTALPPARAEQLRGRR
jgi:integrase